MNATATVHFINAANVARHASSANDWANASVSQQQAHDSWVQQGIDQYLQPAYTQAASYISANGFPQNSFQIQQIAQNVAAYDPSFTANRLAYQINYMLTGLDPGAVQDYAISICRDGASSLLQELVNVEMDWSQNWGNLSAFYGVGSGNGNAPIGSDSKSTVKPNISDACGEAVAGLAFLGVGFLTLAILTGGFPIIAASIDNATFAALGLYGGGITAAVTGTVSIICP